MSTAPTWRRADQSASPRCRDSGECLAIAQHSRDTRMTGLAELDRTSRLCCDRLTDRPRRLDLAADTASTAERYTSADTTRKSGRCECADHERRTHDETIATENWPMAVTTERATK